LLAWIGSCKAQIVEDITIVAVSLYYLIFRRESPSILLFFDYCSDILCVSCVIALRNIGQVAADQPRTPSYLWVLFYTYIFISTYYYYIAIQPEGLHIIIISVGTAVVTLFHYFSQPVHIYYSSNSCSSKFVFCSFGQKGPLYIIIYHHINIIIYSYYNLFCWNNTPIFCTQTLPL